MRPHRTHAGHNCSLGLYYMEDTRTTIQRTKIMRSVGTQNTGPELAVRRILHSMGYRYRLHAKDLPGKPDIVFRSRRKVIFVHGCFWHGHDCAKGRLPKSRSEYWAPKIEANRGRDRRVVEALASMGWRALTIWQCQMRDPAELKPRLRKFLGPPGGISV